MKPINYCPKVLQKYFFTCLFIFFNGVLIIIICQAKITFLMTFLFILKYKFTKHISIHVAELQKRGEECWSCVVSSLSLCPLENVATFFCHLFYQKTCGLVFWSMSFKEARGCVFCWVFRVCFLRKHAAACFALYFTMAYISLSSRNKVNAKKRGRV